MKIHINFRKSFTLIELLVVIMIISLLAGIVGNNVMNAIVKANKAAAEAQIKEFSSSLDQFKLDNGKYPGTDMGLKALTTKPAGGEVSYDGWTKYMDSIPKDPWEKDYNYLQPGTNNQEKYDIWSNGPDRQSGTEDDITNWSKEE